jgi:hypothetical protein
MSRALERALARLFRGGKRLPAEEPIESLSPAAFRAVVDERLRNLERQLDEVKGRVNGLLFLLAGAVATQVVIRLFA